MAALRATLTQDAEAWTSVEQRYSALIEKVGGEARARLLNNLAMAQHRLGKGREAVETWSKARAARTESDAAELNWVIAKLPEDQQAAHLAALSDDAYRDVLRYQSAAWHIHRTETDETRRRQQLQQAEAKLRESFQMPLIATGKTGVFLDESFSAHVGFSSVHQPRDQGRAVAVVPRALTTTRLLRTRARARICGTGTQGPCINPRPWCGCTRRAPKTV